MNMVLTSLLMLCIDEFVRGIRPVQTGPGAHTASCTMVTGSLPGVKYDLGVLMTTHPLLVQRLWKSTGRFTHSMPFPCRAHAVPLQCRAAKGLECVFLI